LTTLDRGPQFFVKATVLEAALDDRGSLSQDLGPRIARNLLKCGVHILNMTTDVGDDDNLGDVSNCRYQPSPVPLGLSPVGDIRTAVNNLGHIPFGIEQWRGCYLDNTSVSTGIHMIMFQRHRRSGFPDHLHGTFPDLGIPAILHSMEQSITVCPIRQRDVVLKKIPGGPVCQDDSVVGINHH